MLGLFKAGACLQRTQTKVYSEGARGLPWMKTQMTHHKKTSVNGDLFAASGSWRQPKLDVSAS